MSGSHTGFGAMNDGRFITDYRQSCVVNSELAAQGAIATEDSAAYRQHLQRNGLALLRAQPTCGPMGCDTHSMAATAVGAPAPVGIDSPAFEAMPSSQQ